MAIGPGIYNDVCTQVRIQTQARGVIVIIIDGEKGTGFSCQADLLTMIQLPEMLEHVAEDIRSDESK